MRKNHLIFAPVVFLSGRNDGSYRIRCSFLNGSELYRRSGIIGLSSFKKDMIIYHRCLPFIFSNPFIMKVHYMTPGSHITPLCMWNTCRYLTYGWLCYSFENFLQSVLSMCVNYHGSPSVSTTALLCRLFILNSHNLPDMIADNCYYYFIVLDDVC